MDSSMIVVGLIKGKRHCRYGTETQPLESDGIEGVPVNKVVGCKRQRNVGGQDRRAGAGS